MSTGATNNRAEREGQPEDADRAGAQQDHGSRWSSWALRNWRVRSRLIALIAIPTVVALLLGGFRIWDNATTWATHERIEGMATLGQAVSVLAHELGNERMLAASYVASNPDPERRDQSRQTQLQEQQSEVDEARQTVRNQLAEIGDPGSELARNKLSNMETALDGLTPLRQEIAETRITVLPAVTKYGQLVGTLTSFNEEIAEETDETELRESVRALSSITSAREELSFESAIMLSSLMRNQMSGGGENAINNTRSRYENHIQNFMATATVQERSLYDETYTGVEVGRMSAMRLRVLMRARSEQPLTGLTEGDDPAAYQEVAETSLGQLHAVETQLAANVAGNAGDLRDTALQRALLESALVILGILAVFGLTTLVARSMVRPLRVLRDSALRVADRDLPDAIHRMREADGASADTRIAPIQVDSQDEIGEVARSFDEVHRVALSLAADEATLRSNVNAMFVNLSRRSQTLVERQLRLIEGLEQSEQDSDRLGDLFQLDHLATRMRRNNENLLVLSGQENTRKWAQPVPLVDVLRGAISEVEHYERVNVRAPSHLSVQGRPVNDIIHLVAELVENATAFSSHDTQVSVTARPLESGDVLAEITDSGIGMAPEDLEAINERLAEPPEIDVAVSRRMGLYVVSRLAARHNVHVRLHPARNGGTTAVVVLPSGLLLSPGSPTPAVGGGGGVPDTYAEATAAFAATPAPPEPTDAWQPSSREQERSPWESEPPRALPKRPVAGSGEQDHSQQEHPPSGQDLWAAANKSPNRRTDTGSNRIVGPPQDEPRREDPRRDRREQPQRERYQEWSAQESASAAPARDSAPDRDSIWSRPPQQENPSAAPARDSAPDRDSIWSRPPQQENPSAAPARDSAPDRDSIWSRPPDQANEPLQRSRSMDSDSGAHAGYGSTSYHSGGGGHSGERTVVPPTPENREHEPLPIFDSIESNWFRRRTVRPVTAPDTTGPLTPVSSNGSVPSYDNGNGSEPTEHHDSEPDAEPVRSSSREGWDSEADVGWLAAESVNQPVAGGLTQSGLPRRVPKANLVPGTAPAPEQTKQLPSRSADKVRSRLASLQDGVRQGRASMGDRPRREGER